MARLRRIVVNNRARFRLAHVNWMNILKRSDTKIMKTKLFALLAAGTLTATFAVAAEKGDAAAGKEVFAQCAVCHNADSTTPKVGPGLKGLFKKAKLANGQKVTDAAVMKIINEGAGDGKMPPYADMISEKERADVLAYLKTL